MRKEGREEGFSQREEFIQRPRSEKAHSLYFSVAVTWNLRWEEEGSGRSTRNPRA